MFDIGIGELLALAVIGLLIFGPERLPKAAADAGRWVRQIREMATSARKEIVDSAGVDFSDTMSTFKDFRDLHPKRLASGLLDDDVDDVESRSKGSGANAANSSEPEQSGPANRSPQSSQSFDPDLS